MKSGFVEIIQFWQESPFRCHGLLASLVAWGTEMGPGGVEPEPDVLARCHSLRATGRVRSVLPIRYSLRENAHGSGRSRTTDLGLVKAAS